MAVSKAAPARLAVHSAHHEPLNLCHWLCEAPTTAAPIQHCYTQGAVQARAPLCGRATPLKHQTITPLRRQHTRPPPPFLPQDNTIAQQHVPASIEVDITLLVRGAVLWVEVLYMARTPGARCCSVGRGAALGPGSWCAMLFWVQVWV